jgi:hypothetical protein
MKRKRPQQPEKRRMLVELNLLDESRARLATSSRGCASLLGRFMVGAIVCLAVWQGLSQVPLS